MDARGALAPVWGRVPKVVSKKTHFYSKRVTHLGALFRDIRDFLTFYFSLIFELTSDSKLYALWWPKGSQKKVFGEPFPSDFKLSGESENEAPVSTGALFSRFEGIKKAMDFDAIFGRGPRELGSRVFLHF